MIRGATQLATEAEKQRKYTLPNLKHQSVSQAPTNPGDNETKTKLPQVDPGPTTNQLLSFSVRRPESMRHILRQHTEHDFTINTMLSAIIWVAWTSAYTRRLHHADPAFPAPETYSELSMGYNPRAALEKAGLLNQSTWLGNLAHPIQPAPKLSLRQVLQLSAGGVTLELSGTGVGCTRLLPLAVEGITARLAGTSVWQSASLWQSVHEAQAEPGFDYATARDLSAITNGFNLLVSNWATLDLMPDFGAELGKPLVIRTPDDAALLLPGTCLMLPRHRSGELRDRLDVNFSLREDDWKGVVRDEVLRVVLADGVVERLEKTLETKG